MATIVTDSFQRANSASLGSNWTAITWGGGSAQVVSDTAKGNANNTTSDYWTANTFANDQMAQITVGTLPTGNDWVGATARHSTNGHYLFIYWNNNGTPLFQVYREDGFGNHLQLGSSVAGTMVAGDSLSLTVVGTTITGYHNGAQVIQLTDSTYTSGSPGLMFFSAGSPTSAITQWTGADVFVVQVASNIANASSVTVTLGQNTKAGNTLVVGVSSESSNNGAVTGITLGGSADNFTQLAEAGNPNTSAADIAAWMDPRCAGGQTSVVVTTNAPGTPKLCAYVYEVTGLGPYPMFDQTAGQNSNSTQNTTFSITTPATTWPGEICFGFASGYTTTVTGPAAPWVTGTQLTEGTNTLVPSYLLTSATGTVTFAGTMSPTAYNEQLLVTIAPTQIEYNTGATVAGTGVTAPQFTIPNTGGTSGSGVLVGDVMLLNVSFFTEDSTTPTIAFSGGGSGDSNGWKLVPMTDGSANPQLCTTGGIYSYVWAYYRVATSADLGATITVTETGSPAGTTWSGVSMVAYTGANQLNPIDRAGGAQNGETTQYVVLPTETARIPADWAVFMAGGGFNGGGVATPPAGAVSRQTSMNSGGTGTGIADSNGQVGLNAVGGGHYTNGGAGGNAYLSGFTILLAPAGIYMVQKSSVSNGFSSSFSANVTPSDTIVMVATGHQPGSTVITSAPQYNGASVTGAAKILSNQTNSSVGGTGNATQDVWLLPNVQSAGTSYSITTNSMTGTYVGIFVYEVLGLGPSPVLDKSSSQIGNTTSDQSSGASGATTVGPEFIVGTNVQDGSLGSGYPPAGWTSTTLASNNSVSGYQVAPSSGLSFTYDCGTGNADWVASVVTIAASLPGGNANASEGPATVAVAGVLGAETITLPGPVAGVAVAALEGTPGVSVSATGHVSVAAILGIANAYNPQSGSGLLKLLFP